MYVVIVGCGAVGSRLARTLSREGHDIVVIDSNPEAFKSLGTGFNGSTVAGTGIDEDVLRKAGIGQADALAAVTNNDNTNIMTAQVAKEIFGVQRVMARIFDPDREYVYHELGLETISPTAVGVERIKNALLADGCQRQMGLGAEGEVQVVEIRVPASAAGRTVQELELTGKCVVGAVLRHEHAKVPFPDFAVQEGDRVLATIRTDYLKKVRELFGLEG
ncbi:MAG: potassium channel family protein [Symbiobacteriia bacterium]